VDKDGCIAWFFGWLVCCEPTPLPPPEIKSRINYMSCLCPDITHIQRGGGLDMLCVFMFEKHKIRLILRLKRHIFTLKGHIFLCLCVFRNAPISP
jgi:hypothetical protein